MSPHGSLGAPHQCRPPQLRDGEGRPALATQVGGHWCLGPRVWDRESGRSSFHLHTPCTLTTHTFLAHPVPSPQSQCLWLPTHKIPSASSLFSGLTSTFPSHLHTQLAQSSHICCRGGGGQGDWRGPLLTRVSSPLPRSSQGFMHMKLSWTKEHKYKYVLGQNSPPFSSVPEIVHHYASYKLPIKGTEHMSLLYPVAIRTLWM